MRASRAKLSTLTAREMSECDSCTVGQTWGQTNVLEYLVHNIRQGTVSTGKKKLVARLTSARNTADIMDKCHSLR